MEQMQSEQINELASAMAKMQGELESAAKSSENPFLKNKYADLATVWDVCRLPMSKNGLSLIQQIRPATVLIGDTIVYSNDKAMLVTTIMHSSGQWMRSVCPIITSKQDAQGMGAGITYMRRYAMCAMLGITQDDDDGNSASGITSKAFTEKQLHEAINDLIEAFPYEKKDIAAKYLEHCRAHYKMKKGSKWADILYSELLAASSDVESFIKSVYSWDEKRSSPKA
jgi:hypothetical protein